MSAFLPTADLIASWPVFTRESPLRVLLSACLGGAPCGVDGTCYGFPPDHVRALLQHPHVETVAFCPEDDAMGTPRAMPDITGGNGFDLLDGRAKMFTDPDGVDWSEGIVRSALRMAELGAAKKAHFALMTHVSAACGSAVIYDGPRRLEVYQRGPGVAAAAVLRAGIPVVSQIDLRTLARIADKLGMTLPLPGGELVEGERVGGELVDSHERAWFRAYFGERAGDGSAT